MATKTTPKAYQNDIVRSSAGLRDAIFDEIDAIRRGESNPTRANAVAKLAAGIVETVRMEIEVQKFARSSDGGKAPEVRNVLGSPLQLSAA